MAIFGSVPILGTHISAFTRSSAYRIGHSILCHPATSGSAYFLSRSLVFVTRHSRRFTLYRSLPPFCALSHSWLWQFSVTRNHGSALSSHSGSATELGNRIWFFATTFCAFHNVIANMKWLQLNLTLFRGDATLNLKLYTGGFSGALVVNVRTTAFGELL